MPRIKWFDRKFDFDFPTDLYPELIERLRGTPARVEDRVKGLPGWVLTKRDGEHWSIQENIGHLLDLEELFSGRLDDFDNRLPKLRAADLTNQKTHNAQHNREAIEKVLAEFRRARQALVERLDNADPLYFCRVSHHPRLDKPMRVVDAMYFQAEHDDYHMARISELIPYFEETA
jgi:uncharacterized damage-inducible protein DinB